MATGVFLYNIYLLQLKRDGTFNLCLWSEKVSCTGKENGLSIGVSIPVGLYEAVNYKCHIAFSTVG